ncbi:MAG: MlaD family protein [Prevotellaceae bacterium]|jgi:phospholipid/cholesterol/gamma-HCH transport system substrate-binding protein|nr:MlaD family protein [Prevotellaceae bacterium]
MKITRELKIGIYFVVVVAGLVWGVNFLKGLDLFNKIDKYYAIYENVEGLQTTSSVYIKGLKVGTVSRIEFQLEQGEKFIVELKIKSHYQIPANSTAYIYSSDIMGSKSIKIKLGDSHNYLKSGEQIASGHEGDMFSMFMDDLPSIKDSLKLTLQELDVAFKNINRLFSNENINNISSGLSALEKTLQNVAQISSALNNSKSSIVALLKNVEAISDNLKQNTNNINNIITNFSDLSDSLKLLNLTQIASHLEGVIAKIDAGEGTAGKLVNSDELHNTLSKAVSSLDSLLTDVRKRPKRYVNISIFGRKEK